ncbi:MAG: PAS domain-containing protein [Actinomycetota bacterium]|nr:PAS domain-containing protein [Actinomycetota bacterium]
MSTAGRSVLLILARELASNLATPTFLVDGEGMVVFFNDAAEQLLGKPFSDIGEITGNQLGEMLQMVGEDGAALPTRESPAGIAFYERRPAHKIVSATFFNGERHVIEATAYPLFGNGGELHGVVTVFWPTGAD